MYPATATIIRYGVIVLRKFGLHYFLVSEVVKQVIGGTNANGLQPM